MKAENRQPLAELPQIPKARAPLKIKYQQNRNEGCNQVNQLKTAKAARPDDIPPEVALKVDN